MSAIATLKALLGIDTSEYKAGIKDAEGVTHSFAMKLQDTESKINSASQMSRGFAAVLSGNVAGGIRQIVNGLDLVTSRASMAVTQIGAVFAAFGGGWALGKKIDKWLGISDSFKHEGLKGIKNFQDYDTESMGNERRGMLKEAERKAKSLADLEAEVQKSKDARLQGLAKITRQFETDEAVLKKRRYEKNTYEEIQLVNQLIDLRRQKYRDDVENYKKAEQEKLDAAKNAAKDMRDQVSALNGQYDKRMADVESRPFRANGRGIRTDQMAAIGGMVGASRSGLGAADKQLQIAIEMNRRDQEKMRLENEKIELLGNISDNTSR